MNSLAWGRMLGTEARLVWRDPTGVVLPLALPFLLIIIHSLSSNRDIIPGTNGLTSIEIYALPAGLSMFLAILGLVNVPAVLASYRSSGVLRRMAVTPAHPGMILTAQVVVNAVLGTIGMAIALAFGRLAFDMQWPRDLILTLLAVVLLGTALYAVGMVIAAVAPSGGAAMAIGLILFLGMGMLGGGMLPLDALPSVLADVGRWTPIAAGIELMQAGWIGGSYNIVDIALLGGTIAAACFLSVKLFRWQ